MTIQRLNIDFRQASLQELGSLTGKEDLSSKTAAMDRIHVLIRCLDPWHSSSQKHYLAIRNILKKIKRYLEDETLLRKIEELFWVANYPITIFNCRDGVIERPTSVCIDCGLFPKDPAPYLKMLSPDRIGYVLPALQFPKSLCSRLSTQNMLPLTFEQWAQHLFMQASFHMEMGNTTYAFECLDFLLSPLTVGLLEKHYRSLEAIPSNSQLYLYMASKLGNIGKRFLSECYIDLMIQQFEKTPLNLEGLALYFKEPLPYEDVRLNHFLTHSLVQCLLDSEKEFSVEGLPCPLQLSFTHSSLVCLPTLIEQIPISSLHFFGCADLNIDFSDAFSSCNLMFTLTELCCYQTSIFFPLLIQLHSLRKLRLSEIQEINEPDNELLEKVLIDKQLEKLELSAFNYKMSSAFAEHMSRLTHLCLKKNSCRQFMTLLPQFSHLIRLNLSSTDVDDKVIEFLEPTSHSLKFLHLRECKNITEQIFIKIRESKLDLLYLDLINIDAIRTVPLSHSYCFSLSSFAFHSWYCHSSEEASTRIHSSDW